MSKQLYNFCYAMKSWGHTSVYLRNKTSVPMSLYSDKDHSHVISLWRWRRKNGEDSLSHLGSEMTWL